MSFVNHPIDPDFSRILEMGRNLSEAAYTLGLSATKPITVPVLGINQQVGPMLTVKRRAIVSFSMPTPSAVDVQLWVNPINKRIFKSTPDVQQWKPVLSYPNLFSEDVVVQGTPASGDSAGQPVQDLNALLALNTGTLPDKAMYYVEDERAIYALDANSSEAVNPPSVLKPLIEPGRWYLITSTAGAIGNIDGGIY